MTKWPVQKLAQGTTQKLLQHHDGTDTSLHKIKANLPLWAEFEILRNGAYKYMYLSCVPDVDGKIHPKGVVQHRR